MRISNYPTDTITGAELILATDVDTSTQKYKTVNFSVNTLKEFLNLDELPTQVTDLTISNTAPKLIFTDTTGGAKSGKIKVDTDNLTIRGDSDNEIVYFPLGSGNSVGYYKAIYVDVTAPTYNEFQNETRFVGDVRFTNHLKDIIIEHRDNSGYVNQSNNLGDPEIQFHNTNTNGSDDRLIRIAASTGSGSSGDYGGRIHIYTRINGGNSFNNFMFDDAGKFTAPKFKVSSLNTAPSSATAEGTAGDIVIANDAIYVCVTTGSAGNAAWKKAALRSF